MSDNAIRGTRFSPYARDPWSVLRRTYTGPKLAFLIVFSLLAFLPLAGRAAFFVTLSRLEQRSIAVAITALERTAGLLREVEGPAQGLSAEQAGKLEDEAEELRQARDWTKQGSHLMRLLAPGGAIQFRRRPVWYLLLGIDRGPWTAFLSAALLLYNVARALLTYNIGPLRDEEERTGNTPAWEDYGPWWRLHRGSALLLVLASVSGLYQMATALMTPVLVPVIGAG